MNVFAIYVRIIAQARTCPSGRPSRMNVFTIRVFTLCIRCSGLLFLHSGSSKGLSVFNRKDLSAIAFFGTILVLLCARHRAKCTLLCLAGR
jgi:hypothetical protein